MFKRLHIILYIAVALYSAGCAAIGRGLGLGIVGAFAPYSYILPPIAYHETEGGFPLTVEIVDALYADKDGSIPKIKVHVIDSDSICFKAYVYPVNGSLNSESFYEITKLDSAYTCVLYFDFTAQSDSMMIRYDKYRASGALIAKKDSAGKINITGNILRQSGDLIASTRR